MKTSFLRPCLLGATLFVGLGSVAPVVHAAAKSTSRATRLEIWPGQRTLIVLPLTVSDNFLSTEDAGGSSALGTALVPVISPILSSKLQGTGKFSITRPYKFDPLLRRALLDSNGGGLTSDDIDAFVNTPGLSNARTVLSQLSLDQPGMVAQVVLQRLIVGGTPDMPTVQLTIRGDLYEANSTSSQPFRSITVTSKPFPGKTPEERLRGAADEAFGDIANAFVEPPTEFELPVPTAPLTPAMPGAGAVKPGISGTGTTSAPTMPAMPMSPVTPGGAKTPTAPPLPATAPPQT